MLKYKFRHTDTDRDDRFSHLENWINNNSVHVERWKLCFHFWCMAWTLDEQIQNSACMSQLFKKKKRKILAQSKCLLVNSKKILMTCLDSFPMLLAMLIISGWVSDKVPSDWMLMFLSCRPVDYPVCCTVCTCAPANLKCWSTRENLGCPRSQLWPVSLIYDLVGLWF